MSAHLDLTGLNLQPISLQRSKMSQAMHILDSIIHQGSDDFDGGHVAAVARGPERQTTLPTSNDSCAESESSLAGFDDIDEIDHLSDADNAHAQYSQPTPFCSHNTRTDEARPHHTKLNRNCIPSHEIPNHDVGFQASSFYPPTTNSNSENGQDAAFPSLDLSTFQRHQAQSLREHLPADPRRPPLLPYHRLYHQDHYYGTPLCAAPTATSTNYVMHSAHITTTGTSNYSSIPPFQSPQSRPDMTTMSSPQQSNTSIPFVDFQYLFNPNQEVVSSSLSHQERSQQPSSVALALSRPVISPASAAATSTFLPPTTDTWSASTQSLPHEQQPQKQGEEENNAGKQQQQQQQQRSKKIKARCSFPATRSNQAIKTTTSEEDSPKKTSSPKPEPCFKPIHHKKWQQQYNDLLDFKRQHGHCHVPIAYEAVPTLPHWVKRQRNQYKKKIAGHETTLTDERQQILDAVGFVWDSHQALWTLRLTECRMYRDKHGHCSIPVRYPPNAMLAIWAKCQRRQFKIHKKGGKSPLTAERIDQLNSLDFVWEPLARGPYPFRPCQR